MLLTVAYIWRRLLPTVATIVAYNWRRLLPTVATIVATIDAYSWRRLLPTVATIVAYTWRRLLPTVATIVATIDAYSWGRLLPTVVESSGDISWRRRLTRRRSVAILLQSCCISQQFRAVTASSSELRPSGRNPTSPPFRGGAFAPPQASLRTPKPFAWFWVVLATIMHHLHGFGYRG